MYKILFADDDRKIAQTAENYFSARGVDVTPAFDGSQAVALAQTTDFDLIILDVMMPGTDGLTACKEIRKKKGTPVLFLSALGTEGDQLKGYSAGADDYISKPFPLSVLYEKSMAMIRRFNGQTDGYKLTAGKITLDCAGKKVFADGREITVSARDFEILQYLISRPGIVLSRELILSRAWGYDFEGDDRVVDTHVKNIRKALGGCAGYIRTVPGAGYVFEVKNDE